MLLDKYIIGESLQLLIIGSLCILGVFFGTVEFRHVIDILNEFGVPLQTVLYVMILQMPTGVTYCMPAGVMIATMFTLIRQQNDSEIIALQVSGVPMRRILAPYLVIGLVGAICVHLSSEYIAPQSRNLSEKLLLVGFHNSDKAFADRTIVDIKDASGTTTKLMFFGRRIGRAINGFLVFDLTQKGIVNVVWAQRGEWKEGNWKLEMGQLYELLNPENAGVRGKFETMTIAGDAGLKKLIQSAPQGNLAKTTTQLRNEIESYERAHKEPPRMLVLQYYRRFAHPVSCIFLVLAAAPLAATGRRRRSTLALVYGGLLVFVYFVLQQASVSLSENGYLPPLIGAWLPGCLLCVVGVSLTLFLKKRN